MRILRITSCIPLQWLSLFTDLEIHYAQRPSHLGFIWGEGMGFRTIVKEEAEEEEEKEEEEEEKE